ncbi:MAG TPA: DUF4058 family protein [Pirellulales bacterium]|nr:DUF4058 family protein [Pirellulales bacterium]
MNSPFPGMDPYLEDPAFWSDFHHTFIGCWREAIADVLPEPYEARLDETVQLVQMPLQEVRRGRIEILHRPERSLVAVLEMLSPANKVGDGFAQFCSKRQAILETKTHLVELDLLLGGWRLPLSRPLPAGDYHALISRADQRPDCEVYSWFLRQSLPLIPIPLKSPDEDVFVDLQNVFQQTYRRGRYAGSLRYGRAPHAPVAAKDKRWVMEQKPK